METENLNSKIFNTKNSRQSALIVDLKSQDLWKKRKGLQSNLGIKTPLSKIPLLNVLF